MLSSSPAPSRTIPGSYGRQHEQHARAALEDAESNLAVERLRLQRAEGALSAALAEHSEAWAVALERAHRRADAKSVRAVDALERAEAERAELRAARTWMQRRKQVAVPIATELKRNANGDRFTLTETLAAVREAITGSSHDVQLEPRGELEHVA
ncbi:MAG TPA: hypothetical protein VGM39_17880 [Kofleriaceae bacterium]